MSTLPWGTMNDWMRLEVEQRANMIDRRIAARAARAARRTQAAPVTRPTRVPTLRPVPVSQTDCAAAA